jgi:large subunit ribosomal protein L5
MATETARLKTRYEEEIRPALVRRFGYSSPMQAPKIQKITLNMGVGEAKQDAKMLEAATEQLATIAGQRPSVRRARKSIAAFKLREGMPVGVSVTLRGERGYEFLDRLLSIAIPRIRDFRGLSPRSFDGRGNYSLGVREQTIFPEIDYDSIDQTRGLNITITTSAASDAEAFALLEAFGMPFQQDGRPQVPGDPEAAAEEAVIEAAEVAVEAVEEVVTEVAEEIAAELVESEEGEAIAEAAAEAVAEIAPDLSPEEAAEAAEELAAEVVAEVSEEIAEEIVAETIAEAAVEEIAEELADEVVAQAEADEVVAEAEPASEDAEQQES